MSSARVAFSQRVCIASMNAPHISVDERLWCREVSQCDACTTKREIHGSKQKEPSVRWSAAARRSA